MMYSLSYATQSRDCHHNVVMQLVCVCVCFFLGGGGADKGNEINKLCGIDIESKGDLIQSHSLM